MTLEYLMGADSAMVLNYGTDDQAVIKGLNKLSTPGITRQIVTIDEFRNEFARKFAGGGEYNDLTFGGNHVLNDHKGQQLLRTWAHDRKKCVGGDLMCFLNHHDFYTTDLANDPYSGLQIKDVVGGEVGKNDAYPLSGVLVPNGRLAIYSAHLIDGAAPTMAFVSGGPGNDTITDSGNGFINAGFVPGMSLLIFKSTSNNAVAALITEVAAGTLTLSTKGELNSENAVEGTEIHGGLV